MGLLLFNASRDVPSLSLGNGIRLWKRTSFLPGYTRRLGKICKRSPEKLRRKAITRQSCRLDSGNRAGYPAVATLAWLLLVVNVGGKGTGSGFRFWGLFAKGFLSPRNGSVPSVACRTALFPSPGVHACGSEGESIGPFPCPAPFRGRMRCG